MKQAELDELNRLASQPSVDQERRLLRALFYGDFGSGKSTLALHLVENKAIWITTDSAWVVIYKYPELMARVTRFPFEGFSQIRSIVQAHKEGIEPWCTYDTLIWDTFTTSIETSLRNLVASKQYNDQRDPEVESWTHYNIVSKKLRETVDTLSKSNLNIIYTGHIRDPNDQDKQKKRFAIRANAPEASYNIVAREVSLIGWLYKDDRGSKKRIQFEGTLREQAKSQISTIQETVYNLDQIPELVRQWKTPLTQTKRPS
jgi:AAA domain